MIRFAVLTAFIALSTRYAMLEPAERQLTNAAFDCDLDNNINFSPDGRWLVFDCRDRGGINTNSRLGKVNVATGETVIFYKQTQGTLGVGAASFLGNDEVIAIHAIPGLLYDFTVRGGMIIPAHPSTHPPIDPTTPSLHRSVAPRWLDSRDVTPPFTPGALRGGTHKHEPDSTGQWIGFTYNDHIMKARGSDLRNVGVSKRGIRVEVDKGLHNFTGESFSVLLTACVDNPKPGSDEYQRAEGDCWVERKTKNEKRNANLEPRELRRAFRGTVIVEADGERIPYGEVFLIEIPKDITKAGPLGPLQGTESDYPKPPAGTIVRRLTRTAENPDRNLRGIAGHLRASGSGKWIACMGKVKRGSVVENQVFVVDPDSGEMRQLSNIEGGLTSDPRFSPDSTYVAAAAPNGIVYAISAEKETWGRSRPLTPTSESPASNLVISPNSELIAYNRRINGILQIFTTNSEY